MGQVAVVRQQQETLCVLVQPSHRGKALLPQLRRQNVQHRGLAAVLGGGQYACWLVEHHVGMLLPAHVLPVHADPGGGGLHLFLR